MTSMALPGPPTLRPPPPPHGELSLEPAPLPPLPAAPFPTSPPKLPLRSLEGERLGDGVETFGRKDAAIAYKKIGNRCREKTKATPGHGEGEKKIKNGGGAGSKGEAGWGGGAEIDVGSRHRARCALHVGHCTLTARCGYIGGRRGVRRDWGLCHGKEMINNTEINKG